MAETLLSNFMSRHRKVQLKMINMTFQCGHVIIHSIYISAEHDCHIHSEMRILISHYLLGTQHSIRVISLKVAH